jgi:multidrug efflux system membrane fusion protein
MALRINFYCLFLSVLVLLVTACTKPQEKPQRPPAPVSVATAVRGDVPVRLSSVGSVEATESVSIKPQISGELVGVYFTEGQDLVRGQRIFLIDPRSYQAALKKAESNLVRNRVVMENARRDYERYAQLVKDGIVTQEQAEGYRTKAESAAADLDADRAAVENAKVQLSYCTITAPISGRTGNLAIHRGNVIEANKTSLVTINSIAPINVTFAIPEKELPELRRRISAGAVNIEAELPGGLKERGRIAFMDNTVDAATGTIRLKGVFANPKRLMWPGQFVQVNITMSERKGAVTVPARALQTGQQGAYLLVVKPDLTAEIRPVVAGPTDHGVTVIESGLNLEEKVVTEGQMRVVPGGAVVIKEPKAVLAK